MNFDRRVSFLKKSWQKVNNRFSSIQIIVFYYLAMTILSLILFSLPIFREPGSHVPFLDMVFMAISTISVTGLTTFDINSVFNDAGVLMLEVLFHIGGLGIMMITTFFFIVSKRRITLKQRQLIMTYMNQPRLSGIVNLIRITFTMLLAIEVVFGTIFSIYFYLAGYYHKISEAIFFGFYQAISAVTNSGFDVTGESIIPFSHDYFFIITIMVLIFIGGIGFPVLMDFHGWIYHKKSKSRLPFRFSLFSKIAMLAFFVLFIGGTIAIWLLEKDHNFANMSLFDQWLNSSFYSMTTRNAGLQIHDLNLFQNTTLIIFSLLMFIGCSPSSVGGGIRTTTIAIIGLYLYSFLKNENDINIFGRKIAQEDVRKSVVVFMLSAGMCLFSILFLTATEDHSLISIIVEVTSAFGTTGLSHGAFQKNPTVFGQLHPSTLSTALLDIYPS